MLGPLTTLSMEPPASSKLPFRNQMYHDEKQSWAKEGSFKAEIHEDDNEGERSNKPS